MYNLAILASGTGSNARKIIEYFQNHDLIQVKLVISNRSEAPVLDMAQGFGIATAYVPKINWKKEEDILNIFNTYSIDTVILAGFLLLIPEYLVKAFPNRIINIHPALLPKYGGKGMYGANVHRAVKQANEQESGITIHQVNERYDEGNIIFQAACELDAQDTPEDIAHKVQQLEHEYFAPVIESLLIQPT